MDPTVRASLGKHYRTWDEIQTQATMTNERSLHAQIRNLLNLKGIVFFESRMDRKTTQPKGTPDFIFSVLLERPEKHDPTSNLCVPLPVAWEIKVGNLKLRPEQETMLRNMQRRPNAWNCKVIRSLQEAADELKAMGI